jgi:DNA-binding IclR family transcriptional regulator
VLASWPISRRKEYLQAHPLPCFTELSITDAEQFLALVDEVARAGISIDREEYLVGVNAVAAPIYGAGGALVALLWIVGFASRFKDEVLDHATQQLRAEAEAISRSLGAK